MVLRNLLASLVCVALASRPALAHTSLALPVSREGGKQIVIDPSNSIGCGVAAKPGAVITSVRAGQSIPVAYYRNNHIGGFVRWSILKKGTPETRSNFDANAFFYTCTESGATCRPWSSDKPYSLYKDAADGTPPFGVTCGDTITIPDYLEDGEYVLQFTNFGTGHDLGRAGQATPLYRSCADLKITGGSSKNPKPACPTFVGGDRASTYERKRGICAYYHSNEILDYVFNENDPAKIEANYKFGRPAAVEQCKKRNENSKKMTKNKDPSPKKSGNTTFSFKTLQSEPSPNQ